ncbi:hypothetical protein ACQJBY_000349 [Aegilops geniculata]
MGGSASTCLQIITSSPIPLLSEHLISEHTLTYFARRPGRASCLPPPARASHRRTSAELALAGSVRRARLAATAASLKQAGLSELQRAARQPGRESRAKLRTARSELVRAHLLQTLKLKPDRRVHSWTSTATWSGWSRTRSAGRRGAG